MMIMAHGTVGLQHASMAIYNAYADRVPVYIILGNMLDINYRRGSADWYHSVQDAAAMVRDYTKWDDAPVSLCALRRIRRARLQDRDDAAATSPSSSWPTAFCRKSPSPKRICASRSSSLSAPPAGRFRRRQGSREASGRRRESGDRCGPLRAHAPRHRAARRTRRRCCRPACTISACA